MNNRPESNEKAINPKRNATIMSRALKLLRLGHSDTDKKEIFETKFRHPSMRSTIPDSPEGIEDVPPNTSE